MPLQKEFCYSKKTTLAASLLAMGASLLKGKPLNRAYNEGDAPGSLGTVTWLFEPKTKFGISVRYLIDAWNHGTGIDPINRMREDLDKLATMADLDEPKTFATGKTDNVGRPSKKRVSGRQRLQEIAETFEYALSLMTMTYLKGSHDIREQLISALINKDFEKKGLKPLLSLVNDEGHRTEITPGLSAKQREDLES